MSRTPKEKSKTEIYQIYSGDRYLNLDKKICCDTVDVIREAKEPSLCFL